MGTFPTLVVARSVLDDRRSLRHWRRLGFFLVAGMNLGDIDGTMSATEATAEVFVTAFKALKPRAREAVLERMLADEDLSEDMADTLALEARRHQPRQSFRKRGQSRVFELSHCLA